MKASVSTATRSEFMYWYWRPKLYFASITWTSRTLILLVYVDSALGNHSRLRVETSMRIVIRSVIDLNHILVPFFWGVDGWERDENVPFTACIASSCQIKVSRFKSILTDSRVVISTHAASRRTSSIERRLKSARLPWRRRASPSRSSSEHEPLQCLVKIERWGKLNGNYSFVIINRWF